MGSILEDIEKLSDEVKKTVSGEEALKTEEECEIMLKVSNNVIEAALGEGLIKEDMSYSSIIMLALGRATAIILYCLDKVGAIGIIPPEILYEQIILPSSLALIKKEKAEKEEKEASESQKEEKKEEDGE